MKIAIDVRSLMGGRHSGVEEYTIQIIKALIRVAPEHEYQLFYNSWKDAHVPMIEGAEARSFGYPNKLFNLTQFIFNWPKWDKWVEADVFFVPNGRLLPLSPNVPYVVTVHDLSYELFPEFYSRWKRIWHKLVKSRYLVQNADHVIAVSRATADDVVNIYGVEETRVSVIYSGVDLRAVIQAAGPVAVAPLSARRTVSVSPPKVGPHGIPSGLESFPQRHPRLANLPEKFILFLGTLEPRKNVVGLVEAWSVMADHIPHDLVIAGTSGWLEGEADEAIARSRHKQRIHRIGFVDEEEKRWLYRQADLFVYPSFYEGFGFPPLEALLAGTPVVTSNNSSLPEVVGEWSVMVNPYDVTELALVMEEVIKNPPVITAEVKEEIRIRFDWDEAARSLLEVLERVR